MLAKLIADDLLSDENGAEVIAEINKSVDIPIISEATEQKILEALWKVIKSVLLKKIGILFLPKENQLKEAIKHLRGKEKQVKILKAV